jgi:hypothetical protein
MKPSSISLGLAMAFASRALAATLFVAPQGEDANPGTQSRPLRTFAVAQEKARRLRARSPVTVWFRGGTYYLPQTLVLTAADSGTKTAPAIFAAWPGETVVLSGGEKLALNWQPFRDGIMQANVSAGFTTDQLFVNGERQPLARYPNFDATVDIFNGYAADALSPERVKRWADPRGGFIHALHQAMWGGLHYVITGKDTAGDLTYEGGWQNNRPASMHKEYRFVENIFEELDAPGEWFLDLRQGTLFFKPPPGLDLARATIEAVRLRHLIELRGTAAQPVRFVTLRGFTFRHTTRTFMETREPLLRSDWTIYRGGAVFFDGAEDCALDDCFFDQPGGNAVFVNNYNRRLRIRGCHIARAGANGVAFVGDPQAVRDGVTWKQQNDVARIDRTPGPRTDNFPANCLVEDCLIHATGRVEKQTAGVEIDLAQGITVRHCSIYDVPRAGLNIGNGAWGGHVIEFCDVFDTVKETGDHGSFNSWGRDRFWDLRGVDLNTIMAGADRGLPFLDAVRPTVLRHNRWRCDHGWDIDLDDGSSNYEIRDNLCLNGGLKNREGFHRVVENNVIVHNSFHPHVWFRDSGDVFRRNLVFMEYRPINVPKPWGAECDFNLLHAPGVIVPGPAAVLQRASGRDEHSVVADAEFVNPAAGDYRVKPGSPALALGFRNFTMDQFGVQRPALKAIARTPLLPAAKTTEALTGLDQWKTARTE